MIVVEIVIFDGLGVRINIYRYGDYVYMIMDLDGFIFWIIVDYFLLNNFWRFCIVVIRILGFFINDVGVSVINDLFNGILINVEVVEVSIRNYSLSFVINVLLEFRVDGNLVVFEMYVGIINFNEVVIY